MKAEKNIAVFVHDGMEYSLDINNLTGKEAQAIEKVTGIPGFLPMAQNLQQLHLPTVVALMGVAMTRAGHTPDYDKLMDLTMSDIELKDPPTKGAGKKKSAPSGTQS